MCYFTECYHNHEVLFGVVESHRILLVIIKYYDGYERGFCVEWRFHLSWQWPCHYYGKKQDRYSVWMHGLSWIRVVCRVLKPQRRSCFNQFRTFRPFIHAFRFLVFMVWHTHRGSFRFDTRVNDNEHFLIHNHIMVVIIWWVDLCGNSSLSVNKIDCFRRKMYTVWVESISMLFHRITRSYPIHWIRLNSLDLRMMTRHPYEKFT